MTYFGTNTYLIETPDGLVVLDPGPEDHPDHLDAILRHTGGQIAFILVSHTITIMSVPFRPCKTPPARDGRVPEKCHPGVRS